MTALRRHLLTHRRWAAWLLAAALLMRLLVPTGYMLAASPTGGIDIVLCSGFGPVEMPAAHAPAGHAMHQASGAPDAGHGTGHGKEHGAAKDMPCAFAGVAAASLAATDPLVLATALFFILATAFRLPARRPTVAAPFLRPPLRGPPLPA